MEGAPLTQEQVLACARYEFHQGKQVEEAYQNFCKTLGNDAMTYRDFDYWFYRFKDGLFDLDHDRNKKPKQPELFDIPNEILKMIIGKLTFEEKLVLRNVSKSIREVVDNIKYSVESCFLFIEDEYGSMRLENFKNWEEVDRESWKQTLNDFVIMMNWPRMKLESLDIDVDLNEQDTIQVLEAFKSLNHRIPVAEFEIFLRPVDRILAVLLPYLEPGILEHINITGEDYINWNEIVELDQWKQAKNCIIRQQEFPIECLFHFEWITLFVSRMSVDDVQRLKNALLASPNFESCYLTIYNEDDKNAILDAFEEEIIPIPETNQIFEIKLDGEDEDGTTFTIAFSKTSA